MKFLKGFFLCLIITIFPPYIVWADETLTAELLREYREALSELASEPADANILKEKGKLYYFIGEASHDRESIRKAISIFEKVLKEQNDAEIKVFLGSAYTIKARDFPLRWAGKVTPLGFIRIYYLEKGTTLMDEAVEQDKFHPVLRIIRGSTYINVPRFFGKFYKGMKDLELLISWIENPNNNKYSEIILDKGFMSQAYYQTGEAYLLNKEEEKAIRMFKKAASIIPDTPIGRAALRRLNDE